MAYPVSKLRFGELVEQAVAELPPQFAAILDEVPIEIRDRASAAQRQKMGLRRDELLLGLYHGRPLTRRSVEDSGRLPDVIYVFQEDIERSSNNEQDLIRQVRITVLHEIGHHFGLNEKDLDELGYG
ncbi:MAG TPA: metallopeptidase family protein [Humisphaera sp.]|jgi:predicted Zn-dependent protease with MMP-like domain|nr:metallopeptidase family protein [Humisphaera sp.]